MPSQGSACYTTGLRLTFSVVLLGVLMISGAIHGRVPRWGVTLVTYSSRLTLLRPKSATWEHTGVHQHSAAHRNAQGMRTNSGERQEGVHR